MNTIPPIGRRDHKFSIAAGLNRESTDGTMGTVADKRFPQNSHRALQQDSKLPSESWTARYRCKSSVFHRKKALSS